MKYLALTLLLSLTACSQVEVKDVLTNLDKDCVRHYSGSLSTGQAGIGSNGTVTFNIDCKPSGTPAVVTP